MPIKMPKKQGDAPSPEEFITGATAAASSLTLAGSPPEELPWRDPRVRDDLRVQVNAKLPEKLMIQRDWLAARLRIKKQDILEIALRSWVERELRKLGLDKG
jgi:hypothetical protein